MSEFDSAFAVFIDYDNLSPLQKQAGVLDVVTRAMLQIPLDSVYERIRCDVRIYGGWYEGAQITRMAQDVVVQIQSDFPAIVRIPKTGIGYVRVLMNAELAVSLLQEPGHHLFNTYRRKGKPANIRVENPQVVGCADVSCVLPMMKKLLRSGNCPKAGCGIKTGNLVYRDEQKIVDTMLSCDLIHAARSDVSQIILVSGDDDFLPPLRTVLLNGVSAIRFHPKPNCQRASFPMGGGKLLELDL